VTAFPSSASSSFSHKPVMVNEVLCALAPRDGAIYVDATFGRGGYAKAVLDAADCLVWGIDRDPKAVACARELEKAYPGRLRVLEGCFGDMKRLLGEAGVKKVDGIAFDLGVSSPQIDDPERGFSFSHDGPLDMRMSEHGTSALDVVNTFEEGDLADIIYRYGEERRSRRIAHAIAEDRAREPIMRTGQLADLVRRIVARTKDGIDPATRTFQALRIYVNDELGELKKGLSEAECSLNEGGRLAVVAFHSLEDRIVKEFLKQRSGKSARPSRHLPETKNERRRETFRLCSRGVLKASALEIGENPRARSARLRTAERTKAPSWNEQSEGEAG
jgi:16S rRNA (cytosine1402-N4)-methyltransferase